MHLRLNEPIQHVHPLSRLAGRGVSGCGLATAITRTLVQIYSLASASIAAASDSMAM
jgi:hypothetical protein